MGNPKNKKTIGFLVPMNVKFDHGSLKPTLRNIFNDMWDAMPKTKQSEIMKKYGDKIPNIMEMLK